MVNRAYVGLGSNLGLPQQTVLRAAEEVARLGGGARVSSLYRTDPQGNLDQPPFCNAVVAFSTAYDPYCLLRLLTRIERRFGRFRREPWGPRTLDLDLLLFGTRVIQGSLLTVPHPRLGERRFVLAPLAELCPHLSLPDGRLIAELLKRSDIGEVQFW